MSLRDRKQLACAISFRDVSLSIAPSPITGEYVARHSHAHCVFLVIDDKSTSLPQHTLCTLLALCPSAVSPGNDESTSGGGGANIAVIGMMAMTSYICSVSMSLTNFAFLYLQQMT